MSKNAQILRVDASMRYHGSVSRKLADTLTEKLGGSVLRRDLATEALPFVNETWINGNFTPDEQRNEEQRAALALSDRLIEELQEAETLVIATPIYNFAVPAALKAWVDLIARVGRTFRYTENGPVGLLEGKKAYLVVVSGGTEIGGDIDFGTDYLKHMLGFVGISDVTVIGAGQLMAGGGCRHRRRAKAARRYLLG